MPSTIARTPSVDDLEKDTEFLTSPTIARTPTVDDLEKDTELPTSPTIARTPTVDDLEKERLLKLLAQQFRKRRWQEETR